MSSSSRQKNILDRPLPKGKSVVSLSAFAFLFAELVRQTQARVKRIDDLEKRLSTIGYQVGGRVLELVSAREKNPKRETKLIGILSFISAVIWRSLFGKTAELERSAEDEYMIVESENLVNRFISVPKDLQEKGLNCASFVAGLVEGILDGAEFPAKEVVAHFGHREGNAPPRNILFIKFYPLVIEREENK